MVIGATVEIVVTETGDCVEETRPFFESNVVRRRPVPCPEPKPAPEPESSSTEDSALEPPVKEKTNGTLKKKRKGKKIRRVPGRTRD